MEVKENNLNSIMQCKSAKTYMCHFIKFICCKKSPIHLKNVESWAFLSS